MKHDPKVWEKVISAGYLPLEIPKNTPFPEAVILILGSVVKHFRESTAVRQYLADLDKGPGSCCPDSPVDQLVEYVATQRGDIAKNDPLINLAFMREIIEPVFSFERHRVYLVTEQASNVTTLESHTYSVGVSIAYVVDQLWYRWFESIVVPYQLMSDEERRLYQEQLAAVLAKYDYMVFDFSFEDGLTNRRTWARAFPEEIGSLCAILLDLKRFYDQYPEDPNAAALSAYCQALSDAYSCTDVDQLEERWTAVDRAWVRIPLTCRVVPVHGMESGYHHPFGVSPEFRLDVRTAEAADTIAKLRQATIDCAPIFNLSTELEQLIAGKLDHTDVAVFVDALRAGCCMDFRYAGQVVPNRQQVQSEEGVRVFLDQSNPTDMAPKYRAFIKKNCVPGEAADQLQELITPGGLLKHTIGHECGHPLGRSPEIDQAIGANPLVEEAKASFIGLMVQEELENTPAKRAELLAVAVSRMFRILGRNIRENPTYRPYVNENLAVATMLFNSGVAKMTPEGLAVELDDELIMEWFTALETFVSRVLQAYEAKDTSMIEQLVQDYCNSERPEIAALIKQLDRKRK